MKCNFHQMRQRLSRAVELYKENLVGWLTRRRFTLPPELRNAHKITQAIECIKDRWPETFDSKNDTEYPIFIFSAGWRSGSTLMQRLVVSSGEVAIWGEPIGDAAIIPRLAYSLSAITHKYPSDNFFNYGHSISGLANYWIANFTPEISFLRSSHRALFQEWLGTPAKERFGVERWGLKEVRLSIHHAKYLKWLFPNARFIFIYRNLFDAYKSWRGNRWRTVWPNYYSKSPVAYALHWRFLLEGFLSGYNEVDGLLVKFEDLISQKIDLGEIADYIGVKEIDPSILEKKIGAPRAEMKNTKKVVGCYDSIILSAMAGSLLVKLGYKR